MQEQIGESQIKKQKKNKQENYGTGRKFFKKSFSN